MRRRVYLSNGVLQALQKQRPRSSSKLSKAPDQQWWLPGCSLNWKSWDQCWKYPGIIIAVGCCLCGKSSVRTWEGETLSTWVCVCAPIYSNSFLFLMWKNGGFMALFLWNFFLPVHASFRAVWVPCVHTLRQKSTNRNLVQSKLKFWTV